MARTRDEATIEKKLDRLREMVTELGSVVVAYSGGVDSSLLLKVAHEQLGANAIAITAVSPTLPRDDLELATQLAKEIGAEHILVDTDELNDPDYIANSPNRCYHCRLLRFDQLLSVAQQKGFCYVVDGCNYDDLGDHRPGIKAAHKLGVRSPLLEAGLTKSDIRALSRRLGIAVWDRPSEACLATRIPYGTPITRKRLEQIGEAEEFLHRLGIGQLRVRHHGEIARIEVGAESLPILLDHRSQVAHHLRELGFAYVTADLEGYRTGSMNQTLDETDDG